jgi:hypothetical protein
MGHEDKIDEENISEFFVYNRTLKIFRTQNSDLAETDFFDLSQSYPDRYLCPVYFNRVTHFRHHLPSVDWDGIWIHTSK